MSEPGFHERSHERIERATGLRHHIADDLRGVGRRVRSVSCLRMLVGDGVAAYARRIVPAVIRSSFSQCVHIRCALGLASA